MSEIEIHLENFSLDLSIVEIDEHIPSIHFSFQINAKQFDHFFSHKGSFWAENDEVNNLLEPATIGEKDILAIRSMDDNFVLVVKSPPNSFIHCSIKRHGIQGSVVDFFYKTNLNSDEYANIKNALKAFPKWW